MTPTGVKDPHAPEVDQSLVLCYVCEGDVTERLEKESKKGKEKEAKGVRPGLVEIKSDGTGFSGAGSNTVERTGVAFQC